MRIWQFVDTIIMMKIIMLMNKEDIKWRFNEVVDQREIMNRFSDMPLPPPWRM